MTAPVKLNFKVYQGSTFSEVLRWESSTKVYKTITGITKAAPTVITAVAHGLPVGWRTKVTNVLGMTAINSNDNYNTVSEATADTITLNDINSLGYIGTASGGVLEYNLPIDTASFSARMQIRPSLTSTTLIKELTTANDGILIDNGLKTITIFMSATDTAAFTFSTAVYSLELISSSGIVTQLVTGNMSLVQEVTR